MSYSPVFSVTTGLVRRLEEISALRERIMNATVQVAWIPALQKDARTRNAHSSTAIEGNPLTLKQVQDLEEGREPAAVAERPKREVVNYFAGLRFIEKRLNKRPITHDDLLSLHKITAGGVMDQGEAGKYRTIAVRVGSHVPPPAKDMSGLMYELLEWWNGASSELSPILSSGILHFRFEDIHPFADGNGRLGRMLALWELYRRSFDSQHIFSVDEFYWEDRPRYYRSLESVRKAGGDMTTWLEYTAEGVHKTLERVWRRIQNLSAGRGRKQIVLRPKQEELLRLLRDHRAMTPREIWEALKVSKQGAMNLLAPLMQAKLIKKIGTKKTGKYVLA